MALGYNLYKTQCDQKVIHTNYFWDKMLYLIYLSRLSPWPHQSDEYIYLWTYLIDPNQSISLITLLVFYGVICLYFWVDNSYTIQVLIQWDTFYIISSFEEVIHEQMGYIGSLCQWSLSILLFALGKLFFPGCHFRQSCLIIELIPSQKPAGGI